MSLPLKFVNRLANFYPEKKEGILAGLDTERKGSFRINTLNASAEEVLAEFTEKNIEVSLYTGFAEKIGEMCTVYTFAREFEYEIKGTDAFYQGKIYLQSLASMVPVFALHPQGKQKILDVCAAPGSKTTQMAMQTGNSAEIIAIEKNALREQKLSHNIKLQGAGKNITTHKIDALKYLNNTTSIKSPDDFDAILLDAPCSAEGRISLSREKSYGFWKMQNILDTSALQYDLLVAAFAKLKKGGTLVYSTCTLAPEENEGVVSRVLETFPEISLDTLSLAKIFSEETAASEYVTSGLSIYDKENSGISDKTIKILPSEYTEGFFVARFRKG